MSKNQTAIKLNTYINHVITEKLTECAKELTELLKDNEELFRNIVESVLLLNERGSGGYCIMGKSEIEQLVWKEYPDLYTNRNHEGKDRILHIISNLYNLFKGTHRLVLNELKKELQKNGEEYLDFYKEEIKQKTIELFYPGGVESDCEMKELNEPVCDIIGEITKEIEDITL